MRLRRIAVSLTLAASVWLVAPRSARAELLLLSGGGGGDEGVALVLGAGALSLSVVSTAVNAVSWATRTRPDWRWTFLGVGLGIVSAIVGGTLLEGKDADTLWPAVGLLGWGAISMTVGFGAAAQPCLRAPERD